MDAQEYWQHVNEEASRIKSAISAGLEGQPDPKEGIVYIVSRASRKHGIAGGSVCSATYSLAAQRLVDETHDIASAEQIEQFLASRDDEASEIRAKSLAQRAQVVIHVDENMKPLDGDGTVKVSKRQKANT